MNACNDIEYKRFIEDLARTTVPALFVSNRRGHHVIRHHIALLKINNVRTRKDASLFVGNAVLSFYIADGVINTNIGRIFRVHGNSGVVAAKFKRNLPSKKVGEFVYIKLYKIDEDEI